MTTAVLAQTAQCAAHPPCLLTAVVLLPSAMRARAVATWPWKAARWRGVLPACRQLAAEGASEPARTTPGRGVRTTQQPEPVACAACSPTNQRTQPVPLTLTVYICGLEGAPRPAELLLLLSKLEHALGVARGGGGMHRRQPLRTRLGSTLCRLVVGPVGCTHALAHGCLDGGLSGGWSPQVRRRAAAGGRYHWWRRCCCQAVHEICRQRWCFRTSGRGQGAEGRPGCTGARPARRQPASEKPCESLARPFRTESGAVVHAPGRSRGNRAVVACSERKRRLALLRNVSVN